MIRIALIELQMHNEVLGAFIRHFASEKHHLTVFTTPRNKDYLADYSQFVNKWIIKKEQISAQQFLEAQKQKIGNHVLVIVISADESPYKILRKTWNAITACVLHNVHTELGMKQYLANINTLTLFKNWLKSKVSEIASNRNVLIESSDILLVPHATILDSLLEENSIPDDIKLKLQTLNFESFRHTPFTFHKNVISIVIPGSVNRYSRNYDEFVYALNKLNTDELKKIRVYLLGNSNSREGRTIVSKFKKIPFLDLYYYHHEPEQSDYDKIILNADLLILPLREVITYGNHLETRLKSCISGNFHDVSHYGKPALAPKFAEILNHPLIDTYGNEDDLIAKLKEKISNISMNNERLELFNQYKSNKLIETQDQVNNLIKTCLELKT